MGLLYELSEITQTETGGLFTLRLKRVKGDMFKSSYDCFSFETLIKVEFFDRLDTAVFVSTCVNIEPNNPNLISRYVCKEVGMSFAEGVVMMKSWIKFEKSLDRS